MFAALARLALYLVLGPLVAMLAGNLVIALAGGGAEVFGPGLFTLENLTASYRIGAVPALLTGIVALLLSRAYLGLRHWLIVAFGGASLSMALAWVVFGLSPVAQGIDPLFYVVAAISGGVSGFVCAALYDLLAGLMRRDR